MRFRISSGDGESDTCIGPNPQGGMQNMERNHLDDTSTANACCSRSKIWHRLLTIKAIRFAANKHSPRPLYSDETRHARPEYDSATMADRCRRCRHKFDDVYPETPLPPLPCSQPTSDEASNLDFKAPLCRFCVTKAFDFVVCVVRPGKRTGEYERVREEEKLAAGEEAESMMSASDDADDDVPPQPRATDSDVDAIELSMDDLPSDADLEAANSVAEQVAQQEHDEASAAAQEDTITATAMSDASGLSFMTCD